MILLAVYLIGLFISVFAGVRAAYSDVQRMIIPNIYSLYILGSFLGVYGIFWLFGERGLFFSSISSHLLGFVALFLLTLCLFVLKAIGGGDSKLMSAFGLWMGFAGILPFLVYTALFGGLLGLAGWALRRWKPVKNPADQSWIARIQAGESAIPYGVAITAGALVTFAKIGYLDLGKVLSLLS